MQEEVWILYILPLILIIVLIISHNLFTEERWIRLQDKAKVRTQSLEAAINSLSDFEIAANRLETWLNEKAKMLAVLGPIGIEPDILKNQKSQVEVCTDIPDHNIRHNLLEYILV